MGDRQTFSRLQEGCDRAAPCHRSSMPFRPPFSVSSSTTVSKSRPFLVFVWLIMSKTLIMPSLQMIRCSWEVLVSTLQGASRTSLKPISRFQEEKSTAGTALLQKWEEPLDCWKWQARKARTRSLILESRSSNLPSNQRIGIPSLTS